MRPGLAGSRAAFEGERKHVTVMFADLRASLSLVEDSDAEDAQALLDVVVAAMSDAVHRYEGVVNQVLGDGIMALFGVPVAHEDHVVRAAHAALAMQASVRALRDAGWAERGVRPQIRVGFHAGEVAIRGVEGDLGTEYRAVGATTHLAARMEQLAPAGKVWTTRQTVELGHGLLRVRSLGPMEVKGAKERVEVFELTGISTRTRFQANAVRGLSQLVDRHDTLATLRTALEDAVSGSSQVAALCGEPGVGKSRLCYELLLRAPPGAAVLEASAVSYGRATPLGLLASAVRALIGIDDDDDGPAVAEKSHAFLAGLGEVWLQQQPAVAELLDLPNADPGWRRLDPVQRRRKIEELVRELLTRWCERSASVLVLEDLHWCDPDSLAFIAGLVDEPPGSHTLMLLTYRPELSPAWARLPHVVRCQIGPLPRPDSERLLFNLLGPAPRSLVRDLGKHTDGNPFFIEESARSLKERGAVREPSAHDGLAPTQVPASIEAVLDARLDRLPEEALDVLQAAAVIGGDCPAELLCTVVGIAADELAARVAPLTRAALLLETVERVTEDGLGVGITYRFKHALIQDVAYRRLARARRRALHERVLDAVEGQAGARLGEHLERLAEHAYRAHAWARSVEYQARACVRAAGRSANQQAIAHLERGLEAVGRLPAGPARSRAEVDVRLIALAPLLTLGRHERLIELLREAEQHARDLDDVERLAKVLSQLSAELWLTAQYDAAEDSVRQSLRLAGQLPSAKLALEISARYNHAMIAHARARYDEALEGLEALLPLFAGDAARRRLGWAGYPAVLVRTFIIATCVMTGDFARAARAFEEGRALVDELNHAFSRTMILEQYGLCLLVQGELGRAIEILRQALAVCEHEEVLTMYTPIVSHLGVALLRSGEIEEATRLLEQAADGDIDAAGHYAVDYLFIGLAEARLRAGNLEAALSTADEVVADTSRCGEPGLGVRASLQRAQVLAALPDGHDAARDALAQVCDDAERLGMHPWLALSLQAQAELALGHGQLVAAHERASRALSIWKRLGAPARTAEVEALLARLA